MLARYITLLRRAPRGMRQRHALFWAVSVTAVVAMVWALSLPSLMKPLPSGDVLADAKEQTRPLGSLWSQARKQIASLMSTFSASSTPTDTIGGAASTTESVAVYGAGALATTTIVLSPEDIQKAQAKANILYRPTSTPAMTATSTTAAPQVVLIATTSRAVTVGGEE